MNITALVVFSCLYVDAVKFAMCSLVLRGDTMLY